MTQDISAKTLLSKLMLLIFIIIFVTGFSSIFGDDNLLIGVMIITGLLMFDKMDIGIKVKQAPFLIVGLFVYIGVAVQLSLLNPLVGIVINMASVFIISIVTSKRLSYKAYLPFTLCYIFAQGTPVMSIDYVLRIAGLLAGSILIAMVYYFRHRKNEAADAVSVQELIRSTSVTSEEFQYAVKIALGIGIAMLISDILHLQKGLWIAATVFSIMQPDFQQSKIRVKQRIIGTLLGIAGFVILFVMFPSHYSSIVAIALSYMYMFVVEYQIQMIFVTINALSASMIMFDYTTSIPMRLCFLAIGICIALLIGRINLSSLFVRKESTSTS